MKRFALAGNPNCGKTTLFNVLTGSTAYVGNWPGVTVDKKEGTYKKLEEPISIIDLPGIYSLSPYTPEEVISRNYILEEKPDCVINIVDATNLERNLYLSTQLLEIDVPMVIALNMMDQLEKNGQTVNVKLLSEGLGIPVVEISALKETNLDELMKVAYEASNKHRVGKTVLENSNLNHLINDCKIAFEGMKVENPLFHAVKLVELDKLETEAHPDLVHMVEAYKATFKDDVFGSDFEAIVADARYKYISEHFHSVKIVDTSLDSKMNKKLAKKAQKIDKKIERNKKIREFFHLKPKSEDVIENEKKLTISDKIDKVLTNRWLGIPIFLIILFVIFHFTFSEDLFYLGAAGCFDGIEGGLVSFPEIEGDLTLGQQIYNNFAGCFANGAINSPGVILANIFNGITGSINTLVNVGLTNAGASNWAIGLVCDGILGGLFAVLGFLPQILFLFLFFAILEDSGYMARVAFILDRIFRKFGLSGRAFMPMIMGFGCSVPAMINTRTLADDKERISTIRVIPFFTCGAKAPILTVFAYAVVKIFLPSFNPEIIVYSMYVLGMIVALVTVIIMRVTALRGKVPPFIMELPAYHWPQPKSLMVHLWDKTKHFVKKAFTIILLSTILIWFTSHFRWDWTFIDIEGIAEMEPGAPETILAAESIGNSILASLGKFIQPIFTPLGFGSQLSSYGWVFAVAALNGLVAKENVISTIGSLALILPRFAGADGEVEEGLNAAIAMVQSTGINSWGVIAFIAFNMLTIPCFAACATAKAELPKGKFWSTIGFWVATSYFVSMFVYIGFTYLWTLAIFIPLIIIAIVLLVLYNNKKKKEELALGN